MYYHAIIMTLYGFVRNPSTTAPTAVPDDDDARAKRLTSARAVAHLVEQHSAHWRMEYAPSAYFHWTSLALFTLLDDLADPASCRDFVGLCRAAHLFALRWPLAKGIFRLVQLSAWRMGISLPYEARVIFHDFETNAWTARDRSWFSSSYPSLAAAVGRSQGVATPVELDRFLDRWDQLVLTG